MVFAATAAIAWPIATVVAQNTAAPVSTPRSAPRVAVVLSGGGAKGMAHIGVLKVLEDEGISPQIVTGTSMGALVGGLYAMGSSPASLDSLVRGLDWPSYFSDAVNYELLGIDRRRVGDRTLISVPMKKWRLALPSGAITGQRISRLLSTLTWPAQAVRDFHALPRDFVAVATDIETGQAVVLDHGSLSQAMRASMSLPSIFEPVTIDNRLLVDGGIVRNLPASDARKLGADIIICSDVGDPLASAENLRSLADVLMQTITFQMNASTLDQKKLCDLYIQPDISGLTAGDFGKAATIVARGTSAAEAMRAEIRALRIPKLLPSGTRHAAWSDSVRAPRITVDGLTGRPATRVIRALELNGRERFTAAALDSAVQRAYATDLYDRVQYRIDAADRDTSIVVSVLPRTLDRAGFGFRFDDTYKASLLFNVILRNRLGSGSTTEIDLRLGQQLRLAAELVSTSVENPRFSLGGGVSIVRTPVPIFVNEQRIAELTASVGTLRAFTGARISRHGGLALEATVEGSNATTAIAIVDSSRRDGFGSVAALFAWDGLDRPVYSRRGYSLFARSEFAAGSTQWMQQILRARGAVPIARRMTLQADAFVGGSTHRDKVPPQRRFQLGGAYPSVIFPDRQVSFIGFQPTELIGSTAVRVATSVQWECRPNIFATARANTGYAGDVLSIDRRLYHTGFGLALGSLTPFGQVELSASGRDHRSGSRVELNIGRMF